MNANNEPAFTAEQTALLRRWVIELHNDWLPRLLTGPVKDQLGVVPPPLRQLSDNLEEVNRRLQVFGDGLAEHLQLLKSVIISKRRVTTTDVEKRMAATFDPAVTAQIESWLDRFKNSRLSLGTPKCVPGHFLGCPNF